MRATYKSLVQALEENQRLESEVRRLAVENESIKHEVNALRLRMCSRRRNKNREVTE